MNKFTATASMMQAAFGEPCSQVENTATWKGKAKDGTKYRMETNDFTLDETVIMDFTVECEDEAAMETVCNEIESRLNRAHDILQDFFMANGFVQAYAARQSFMDDLLKIVPEDGDRVEMDYKRADSRFKVKVCFIADGGSYATKEIVLGGIENVNGIINLLGYDLRNGEIRSDRLSAYPISALESYWTFFNVMEAIQLFHANKALRVR